MDRDSVMRLPGIIKGSRGICVHEFKVKLVCLCFGELYQGYF